MVHRYLSVAPGHRSLDSHRAGYSLHNAGVLDENAVASRLDDAAMMLGDVGVNDLTPNDLKPAKGSALVLTHQSAIANHVPYEDGCEAALLVHLLHGHSPPPERQSRDTLDHRAVAWATPA